MVKAIYGFDGDTSTIASYNGPWGPWFGICKAMKLLRDQCLDF